MGLLIKGLLGALVVVLIGVLAKTKNYAIAGLVPLFPTFALIAHYIVASERGIEALRATIVFGMWSRRGGMLGAVRLAVNPRLEPFPLAQRAAAVDSE